MPGGQVTYPLLVEVQHGTAVNPAKYCEIIFIRSTLNFMLFVGRAIHEFKITTNYSFTIVILRII